MMMRLDIRLVTAFLMMALTAVPGSVADTPDSLSIRMVQASQGSGIDPGLQDVAALMKGNLAFSSFKLLESKTAPLPAPAPLLFAGKYKVTLQGLAGDLAITVTHGRKPVIKTHVKLHGRMPLVLGGIASRNGIILFVLNLEN